MNFIVNLQAFSSEEKVQEFANNIIRISDATHHALRRLSNEILTNDSITSYGLLTEEYALRSRANILKIEAKRFVILDSALLQSELAASLVKIEEMIGNVSTLSKLADLLIAILLFANSVVSRRNNVIEFMYSEMQKISTERI